MDPQADDYQVIDYQKIIAAVRYYIDKQELLKGNYGLYINSSESFLGTYHALVLTNVSSDKRIYEVIHTTNPENTTVTSYLQENNPISYNK